MGSDENLNLVAELADEAGIPLRVATPGRPGRVRRGSSKPTYDRQAWRRAAACRQADPDLFFPIGSTGPAVEQIIRAKTICAACPVQSSCLEFALATNQEYGIWGGLDEEERRMVRRQWRKAAQG